MAPGATLRGSVPGRLTLRVVIVSHVIPQPMSLVQQSQPFKDPHNSYLGRWWVINLRLTFLTLQSSGFRIKNVKLHSKHV